MAGIDQLFKPLTNPIAGLLTNSIEYLDNKQLFCHFDKQSENLCIYFDMRHDLLTVSNL